MWNICYVSIEKTEIMLFMGKRFKMYPEKNLLKYIWKVNTKITTKMKELKMIQSLVNSNITTTWRKL